MRRTLIRLALAGVVGSVLAGSRRRHGVRSARPRTVRGCGSASRAARRGPGGGGMFGLGGPGIGFGGPGMMGGMGRGMGGPGGGGPGGPAVSLSDVLTPAAAFLSISVSTLASDLNGGKTLAQEATAKSKTAADLITAIVAAAEDEPRQREGGRLDHGRPGDEPAWPATRRRSPRSSTTARPFPARRKQDGGPLKIVSDFPRDLGRRPTDGAEGRQDARRRGDSGR